MCREELHIQLLTPLPLTSQEEGGRVLDLWETHLSSYLPDLCGNHEPLDQPFDLKRRHAILEHWKWPFLARRRKPHMESSIWMRRGGILQHAAWKFVIPFADAHVHALVEFVRAAAKALEVDFGCLTLLTQREIADGRCNGTVMPLDRKGTRFNFGISSQDLQKCIPDVYWLTVFGRPFVEMFGKSRLLHAPAYGVEAVSDELVLLQLTPNVEDTRERDAVSAKAKVKAFLGETAFFQRGR
jgi:hypothetical protein